MSVIQYYNCQHQHLKTRQFIHNTQNRAKNPVTIYITDETRRRQRKGEHKSEIRLKMYIISLVLTAMGGMSAFVCLSSLA